MIDKINFHVNHLGAAMTTISFCKLVTHEIKKCHTYADHNFSLFESIFDLDSNDDISTNIDMRRHILYMLMQSLQKNANSSKIKLNDTDKPMEITHCIELYQKWISVGYDVAMGTGYADALGHLMYLQAELKAYSEICMKNLSNT